MWNTFVFAIPYFYSIYFSHLVQNIQVFYLKVWSLHY